LPDLFLSFFFPDLKKSVSSPPDGGGSCEFLVFIFPLPVSQSSPFHQRRVPLLERVFPYFLLGYTLSVHSVLPPESTSQFFSFLYDFYVDVLASPRCHPGSFYVPKKPRFLSSPFLFTSLIPPFSIFSGPRFRDWPPPQTPSRPWFKSPLRCITFFTKSLPLRWKPHFPPQTPFFDPELHLRRDAIHQKYLHKVPRSPSSFPFFPCPRPKDCFMCPQSK